jgi:hypothetical protein
MYPRIKKEIVTTIDLQALTINRVIMYVLDMIQGFHNSDCFLIRIV